MENSVNYQKTAGEGYSELAAYEAAQNGWRVAKSEADIKEAIMSGQQRLFQEFCLTNKNIGDGFCSTLKAIGDSECSIIKNESDIAQRATIHLNSVERDLQNRILENRAILLQDNATKTDRVLDRMNEFERSNAEKLCDIKSQIKDSERRILDQMCADKLDEKNSLIAELRAEKTCNSYNHQFALQNQHLDYLKQMINSVEQNQKFSSKVVQFGAGNLAGTAQTANQG